MRQFLFLSGKLLKTGKEPYQANKRNKNVVMWQLQGLDIWRTVTSKNIKIPLELVEFLEKRSNGRPPGEVLLGIVQDYELLEIRAKVIAERRNIDMRGKTVSEIVTLYIDEITSDTEEMKKVLSGLRLFSEKSKEWKQWEK